MSLSVVIVMQTNVGKSKWMEWYLNMKKHNFKLCISHFNFQYAVYFVLSLFVLGEQNHKEIKSLISRCATTCFFGTILQLDAFDGENQNVIFKTPLCCLFVIIYFVGFFLPESGCDGLEFLWKQCIQLKMSQPLPWLRSLKIIWFCCISSVK